MATIDPVAEARTFINSQLAASAAVTAAVGTRFGAHPYPRTDDYPIITYEFLGSPQSEMVVGTAIIMWYMRFLVRGITNTNNDLALSPAVIAIFDALHGKSGPTANAYIVFCTEQNTFYMNEIDASVQYIHKGGEYLIAVQPL